MPRTCDDSDHATVRRSVDVGRDVQAVNKPIRLRRTLGTFLAWGRGLPAFVVFTTLLLVAPSALDVGITEPMLIIAAPALAIISMWFSGRTTIAGNRLSTGSRLRPIVFERSEIDHVERVPMSMGRWGTDGIALRRFGDETPTPLRYSGGLRPGRKLQWERAIWTWILEDGGPAFHAPAFAEDVTTGDLEAFHSPADARRHGHENVAGAFTYWDARGHRLQHLPEVPIHARSLVSTDHVDADHLRERLLEVLRIRIWDETALDRMPIVEQAQLAAEHLRPHTKPSDTFPDPIVPWR